jgi:hypothetical protein
MVDEFKAYCCRVAGHKGASKRWGVVRVVTVLFPCCRIRCQTPTALVWQRGGRVRRWGRHASRRRRREFRGGPESDGLVVRLN